MKWHVLVLIIAASLIPATGQAGLYQDARDAFNKGDLKTAIEKIFESARTDDGSKGSEVYDLMDRVVREATYCLSTNPEYREIILSRFDALSPVPMSKIEKLPALKQAIEVLHKATPSILSTPASEITSSKLPELKMDALYLDGENSFVELPRGIFDQLSDATVEAWVKWEKFNKNSHVFDFGREKNAVFLQNKKTSSELEFVIVDRKGKNHTVEVKKPISIETWVHIAAVCGWQGMKLYINGEIAAGNVFTGGLNEAAGGANYVGRSNRPEDEYFQGYIAEFRVWAKCRSHQEILSTKDRLLTGKESDLVAYWSFNKVKDMSVPSGITSGPPATVAGTARLISVPAIAPYLSLGKLEETAEGHYQAGVDALKYEDFDTAIKRFQETLNLPFALSG